MEVVDLKHGWLLERFDGSEGEPLPVARVPTVVHLDLIDNGVIHLDPFQGFNALACQWVGERTWTYRVKLPALDKRSSHTKVDLVLEGLDTFATVKLNDCPIGRSENMFVPLRLPVTNDLGYGARDDWLEIEFASALPIARAIREAIPEHKWICWNGEPSRLAVRKAQYHWGWDWGPIFMTSGPWRPVRLETYDARIADLHASYDLSDDLSEVRIKVMAPSIGLLELGTSINFTLELNGTEVGRKALAFPQPGPTRASFAVQNPSLWWPRGYGDPNLYTLKAEIVNNGRVMHSREQKIGLRKVELIQRDDEMGKSFFFRINKVDIFCGGSNWIPADSFLPRTTPEKYTKWLKTLVDGNQNMVRVWGGGIWEDDSFYDTCDELGIMVWQDFMFACGNYPAHSDFLNKVRAEANANVMRLRRHPSIIIYAGNNEDYQIQEQSGLEYDPDDKDPEHWLRTDFPARYIYEHLLPGIMRRLSPHTIYHRGSPYSGWSHSTADPSIGDLHQWNVWHGAQEKYQHFGLLGGRFNSEFGMASLPHLETVKYFITDDSQLHSSSHMMDFHCKAAGHERRLAIYVADNFKPPCSLEAQIHTSQLVQSEAMMFAYRDWRRQFGHGRHCGGALVWQLNDCWPCVSWSIVDYFLRKKAAYYTIKRCLAPLAVGVKRQFHDWSNGEYHAEPPATSTWELWICSTVQTPVVAQVELRAISIATGKDIKEPITWQEITIHPNTTLDIAHGQIDHRISEDHVLSARLIVDGKVVARDTDWPQPFKYLDLSDRGVEVVQDSPTEIRVRATRPTKGLVFEERGGVTLSDSAIDVVPGDEQVIAVTRTTEGDGDGDTDVEPLRWRYLDMRD